MRLLLDANRYSDFVAGDAAVVARVQLALELFLPTVVLGELRAGFLYGSRAAQNEATLVHVLAARRVTVLDVDQSTTHEYARLKSQLRRQGTPLPINDVWIAALAVQHDLPLYTRDKHFDRLPQVRRV